MALNLQALRVFVAVAESGGFSRAAARLRLSQPAVSKAVATLEREVGVPLLERGARGVALTESGAGLLERARELFAVERAAEEELRARRGLAGGVLRVGASTTVATYFLPPLLAAFHAAHPAVSLRVASANTRDIARRLLQRRLDVALVEGPVNEPRIAVIPWREDELVAIAAPTHPLARRRSVHATDLMDEPVIMRERGSGTRVVVESALAARGLAPRVALVLGSTEAIKQSVAGGLGISFVSREAVADQVALGRVVVVRVPDLVIRRPLTELRLRDRAVSPGARAFRSLLRGAE